MPSLGLSYNEFRYTFGAFAATNAGVIMTAYTSFFRKTLEEHWTNVGRTLEKTSEEMNWDLNGKYAYKLDSCFERAWEWAYGKFTCSRLYLQIGRKIG